MDEILDGLTQIECDILIIGGGTAGPMAALKAKRKNPEANVVLLDKANVKRSGAISMGMDGLNNSVFQVMQRPNNIPRKLPLRMMASAIRQLSIDMPANVMASLKNWMNSAYVFKKMRTVNTTLRKFTTLALMCCQCQTGIQLRKLYTANCARPELMW